jgi:hypothetical protein
LSRWSHEHPERDYSSGDYFGEPRALRFEREPEAIVMTREKLKHLLEGPANVEDATHILEAAKRYYAADPPEPCIYCEASPCRCPERKEDDA